ncbi:unnamed protein product [Phytomonas sp. EM1]|nr:unnamed protein product [Phytomonas sp. EM1]|eukprot:CCW61186.1 unnamed protein product [Phytomonas sp. isolate EM1]
MPKLYEYDGWSYERLRQQRGRAHFLLTEPYRYVTVILSPRSSDPHRLFCIDSPCYHAAGPLGEGDIVEIENILCIRCPWHRYLVSLERGEEVLLEAGEMESGGVVANRDENSAGLMLTTAGGLATSRASVTCGKVVQRTHRAYLDESTAILTIEVEDDEVIRRHPIKSDHSAQNIKYGDMCMQIFDIKSKGLSNDHSKSQNTLRLSPF